MFHKGFGRFRRSHRRVTRFGEPATHRQAPLGRGVGEREKVGPPPPLLPPAFSCPRCSLAYSDLETYEGLGALTHPDTTKSTRIENFVGFYSQLEYGEKSVNTDFIN